MEGLVGKRGRIADDVLYGTVLIATVAITQLSDGIDS